MKERLLKEQDEIYSMFYQMLEEAISRGEIRQGIDKEAAVMCIIGIIIQVTSKNILMDNANAGNIASEPLLDILMNGLANK